MNICRILLTALAGSATIMFHVPSFAAPVHVGDLYEATAIVTGQGEENRNKGLALCLQDVLVKVSGDPSLANLPEFTEVTIHASTLVDRFDYRDRMEGIPVHDEQGSRDRPYDLTASFNPAKVDAVLTVLGSKPWGAERPTVAVVVAINTGDVPYLLAQDGTAGRDQMDALSIAADRLGVPIAVPGQATLKQLEVTGKSLLKLGDTGLKQLTDIMNAEAALTGKMVWSDEARGWITDWHFTSGTEPARWQVRGGSFDHAFRKGLGGAAQILSGNGVPK